MMPKGGQKHKIANIEANNAIEELKLHQSPDWVDEKLKWYRTCTCYVISRPYDLRRTQKGTQMMPKGGQKQKIANIEANNAVEELKLHQALEGVGG